MKLPIFIVVLGLAACGEEVLSGPRDVDGDGIPDGPGPTSTEAIAACADLEARERLDVHISFPNPGRDCPWLAEGNVAMRDAYFTGRIEQRQSFELPAGAVLCDLDFGFEEQRFRYDDHFLMHLNGTLLVASFDFSPELGTGELLDYDWTKVLGIQWFGTSRERESTYCPGKDSGLSTCSFPQTDTPGRINLDVKPTLIQDVMLRDTGRTTHEVTFVTIGDNDPGTDCRHDPLALSLSASYVVVH